MKVGDYIYFWHVNQKVYCLARVIGTYEWSIAVRYYTHGEVCQGQLVLSHGGIRTATSLEVLEAKLRGECP